MAKAAEAPDFLSAQTLLSLVSTVAILAVAYVASLRALPRSSASSTTKLRVLFIWHLADGLCHLTIEAAYLYNCFFTSIPSKALLKSRFGSSSAGPGGASFLTTGTTVSHFLGRADRAYGPAFGHGPSALLWQEYAKADARWGHADTTVVSLELLTVLLGGPIALYVADLIRRGAAGGRGGHLSGKLWFWSAVLATGELYGGFMTFCPEWLSGSANLNTSHFMYTWLYLTFFNVLWVFFPVWVLYEGYNQLTEAFSVYEKAPAAPKSKKKA